MNTLTSTIYFLLLTSFPIHLTTALVRKNFSSQCRDITLRFGSVRYKQRGRIARFICHAGYMLVGERHTVCVHGQWDNPNSRCIKPVCRKAEAPPNMIIHSKVPGGIMNFYCLSGFQLHGSDMAFCDGQKWDKPLPTCLPSNVTKPPLSCDFESKDLCGWNHDLNHDFDWRRQNLKTESGDIGTGPQYDHTKGAGQDGYYMYIESSSRQINDTARLISPVYPKSNNTLICFEFFYHMYGRTTGELRVYLKTVNDTWQFDVDKAFFHEVGNQGNHWWRSFTNLGVIDQDYQIVIEGVRGSSYISDIAIDDVRIIENCVEQDYSTTTEDFTETTEEPFLVESCKNRCNTVESQQIINHTITCDCDKECSWSNRCCVDYFDYCIVSSSLSDDYLTSETTLEETLSTTSLPTKKTTISHKETTFKRLITTPKTKLTTIIAPVKTTPVKEINWENDLSNIPPEIDENSDENVIQHNKEKSYNERIVIKAENKQTEKESQLSPRTKILIYLGLVAFGVVFVGLPVAYMGKRLVGRGGRMNSAIGDSQSDVRFLTSDEILDFSLQDDDL